MNLRSFAVHLGRFWGLRRAGKPVFYRKWTRMDANGGTETAQKENFSRKTGNSHENRMGTGFIVVSRGFPAWVGGSDGCRDTAGWANPPYRWERENQFRMLNIECRRGGGSGGPEKAFWGAPEGREAGFLPQMDANGRKWGDGNSPEGKFQQENRKFA